MYDYQSFHKYYDFKYVNPKTVKAQEQKAKDDHENAKCAAASFAETLNPVDKLPMASGREGRTEKKTMTAPELRGKGCMDGELDKAVKLTPLGEKLRSHANNTLLKFLQAFRKTNVINITKASSLINNLISFSRDQLS